MLILLSPAKTLDFDSPINSKKNTQPRLLSHSQLLIDELSTLSANNVSALMGVSDKLGKLNAERFQQWTTPFTLDNAKQALFTFKGDVYTGMAAEHFSSRDINFAQQHLRILSGLYGVLRPLDLMQAYRLEMGTRFENTRGKNLYAFWGDLVTQEINRDLKKDKIAHVVNLASNEYFKAVKIKQLNAEIITPIFKDEKKGEFKIISFYAKKARGMMAAFIIQSQLSTINDLKKFNIAGYRFSPKESTATELVFNRREKDLPL